MEYEVKFHVDGGFKPYRFADAAEYNENGELQAIYQVGRVNKNGTIVSRELKVLSDISKSPDAQGVPLLFKPYNTDENYYILYGEDE